MHGNTAVVTRLYMDVQFFARTDASFELTTKIDIDYAPTAAALSGNTAVIGSAWEDDDAGAAYVYERDPRGVWSEVARIQPRDMVPEALFGCSVAVDADVLVVGALGFTEGSPGSAYVYRRNDTTWTQETKLSPPNNSAAEDFGWSVSVKNTSIVIGDDLYSDGEGAVFVYEFDPSTESWHQLGGTLRNNNCDQGFGSVARLADEGGLLVRCLYHGSVVGTVYYYEKQETGEYYVLQQRIEFGNVAAREDDEYGDDDTDVDVSAHVVGSLAVDGTAMVVSEFKRQDRSRVLHFFVRKGNAWEEVAAVDEPTLHKYFGERVALFGNSTLVASNKNVYLLADYFDS